MNSVLMPEQAGRDQRFPAIAVFRIEKDELTAIASQGHVINATGNMKSRLSCHDLRRRSLLQYRRMLSRGCAGIDAHFGPISE